MGEVWTMVDGKNHDLTYHPDKTGPTTTNDRIHTSQAPPQTPTAQCMIMNGQRRVANECSDLG